MNRIVLLLIVAIVILVSPSVYPQSPFLGPVLIVSPHPLF